MKFRNALISWKFNLNLESICNVYSRNWQLVHIKECTFYTEFYSHIIVKSISESY